MASALQAPIQTKEFMSWFKKKTPSSTDEAPQVNIPEKPLLISVDFDGTCVEHKYPAIGKTMPGCVETLQALVLRDHKLILWTCREDSQEHPDQTYLSDAVQWFKDNEIPIVGVNETPLDLDFRPEGGGKVYADLYIDDTNFGGFPGWHKIHYTLTGMPLIC